MIYVDKTNLLYRLMSSEDLTLEDALKKTRTRSRSRSLHKSASAEVATEATIPVDQRRSQSVEDILANDRQTPTRLA